jgi:hypothetical protein
VGGVAAAGVGALAGGGSGAAAGTGSAASAGGGGSGITAAVARVGSVGAGSSAGGGSVSPPSSPSTGSVANGGGLRRQPDPPSNGAGEGGVVDPAPAVTHRNESTARTENTSSGTAVAPGPALATSQALSSIGGEPLAGSGFETQSIQRGFVPASVSATARTPAPSSRSTASGSMGVGGLVVGAPLESVGPPEFSGAGGAPVVSDISSVGSAGPTNPQPAGTKGALSRAADQVRGFRRRLGQMPSDAAPHATPPRIPIEHEE